MIASREIIQDPESGLVYSNQVTLVFQQDGAPAPDLVAHIDPDGLYDLMHEAIGGIPGFATPNKQKPETPEEKMKAQLAKLMRAGIKGLLITLGPLLLDVLFESKEHPKPGKQDDLIPWYQDMLTRIAITHLMKNDVILTGSIAHGTVEQGVLLVRQVVTRSIAASLDGQAGEPGGDATGTESAEHSDEDGTGGPRPASQ